MRRPPHGPHDTSRSAEDQPHARRVVVDGKWATRVVAEPLGAFSAARAGVGACRSRGKEPLRVNPQRTDEVGMVTAVRAVEQPREHVQLRELSGR